MARILFLGEVVGRCGTKAVQRELSSLREELSADYVVINGEGASTGYGINRRQAAIISHAGADTITGGEKLFYKIDMVEMIDKTGFVIRPLNYPPKTPGKFCRNFQLGARKYLLISLMGNAGMKQNLNNAFTSIDGFLSKVSSDTTVLIVFHAGASAEKSTLLHHLDGKVAAIIGTHTKCLTADEWVTPRGTAFITDNGKIGAIDSVGGLEKETEIMKLRTAMPLRSKDTYGDTVIEGAFVVIDDETGKANSIERVRKFVKVEAPSEKEEA